MARLTKTVPVSRANEVSVLGLLFQPADDDLHLLLTSHQPFAAELLACLPFEFRLAYLNGIRWRAMPDWLRVHPLTIRMPLDSGHGGTCRIPGTPTSSIAGRWASENGG